MGRRRGKFGVRRRSAVLHVWGTSAVHWLLLPPFLLLLLQLRLLLMVEHVYRQRLKRQRET